MKARDVETDLRADPFRVLLLLTGRGFGGVETHSYLLAKALARAGMKVALTSFTELSLGSLWEADLANLGVQLVRPPEQGASRKGIWRIVTARREIRRQLRGERFDRVIGQGHGGTLALMREYLKPTGRLLWQEYWHGLPTHGDDYASYAVPPARRFGWKMKWVLRSVDGVVTGCRRASRNLREIQGYAGPLLVVPPMTLDPETSEVARSQRADRTLKIVFVGRLGRGKGAEALLKVWPSLEIGPAELHFHGSVPPGYGETIIKRYAEMPHVTFHGPFSRDALAGIMHEADLGLMLSIEEGFGLVACEYMAAGVPFVMTDCGAAEEFTAGNGDACRVEVSPVGIQTGIEEMIRRIRAGATSRERLKEWFRSNFDWERIRRAHVLAVETEPTDWCSLEALTSRPTENR